MNTYDQASSLFWLCYSIFIVIESLRLGIGKLHAPGTAFMAFGASGLLGILSLILFLKSISKKEETQTQPLFTGLLWKKALSVLIALLIYSEILSVVGYLISTFLLMGFLFWVVERQKVWRVLILSFLTTLITYYVFSKWLNCQFPEGLFRL
jgi:hypothetical protein